MPTHVNYEVIPTAAPYEYASTKITAVTDGTYVYICDGTSLYSFNPATGAYNLLTMFSQGTGAAIAVRNNKIYRLRDNAVSIRCDSTATTPVLFDTYNLATQVTIQGEYSVDVRGLGLTAKYAPTNTSSRTPTTNYIGNKWYISLLYADGSWLSEWTTHHRRTIIFDLDALTLSVVGYVGSNDATGSIPSYGNKSNSYIMGHGGLYYTNAAGSTELRYWRTLRCDLRADGSIVRENGKIGTDTGATIIQDTPTGFYTIGGYRSRSSSTGSTPTRPDWQFNILYTDMLRNTETVILDTLPLYAYAACLIHNNVYIFARDEVWRVYPADTQLDLTTLVPQLSVGTHTIKANASAPGLMDSVFSNEVSYTVYGVEGSINNGSLVGASKIGEYQTITLTIVPDEGYIVPVDLESISIVGATQASYDSTTGELTIGNPAGTVQITATCPVGA